jgi:hypothetical protein
MYTVEARVKEIVTCRSRCLQLDAHPTSFILDASLLHFHTGDWLHVEPVRELPNRRLTRRLATVVAHAAMDIADR